MAKLINRKSIELSFADMQDGYVPRWNAEKKQWEGVEFEDELYSPYDIPFSMPMIEPNGRRSFIVNVNGEINPFQPGYAYAEVTPTDNIEFKIYRNEFHVGNVEFVAGVNVGSIVFFSGVSFFEGNRFTIEAPSNVEGIENVTIALQGRILLPMQEAPEWEDFILNQFLDLSGVDPEGALAQQIEAELQPGGSLYAEFGPDGQFLTNAGFITWGFLIFQDYINTNGDGFTPEQREDFILKLQPFYVDADNNQSPLYNQFSPYRGGSGETDSNFIFALPYSDGLNEIQIVKSGDTLQWHLDRTYTQNNSPTAQGDGIVFITSTDGFEGVTEINFGDNGFGTVFPTLPFVNLEKIDASQTAFETISNTDFITRNLTELNIQNNLLNVQAHEDIYDKLFQLYDAEAPTKNLITILNAITQTVINTQNLFDNAGFNYNAQFIDISPGSINAMSYDEENQELIVDFNAATGGFPPELLVDLEFRREGEVDFERLNDPKENDDTSALVFNVANLFRTYEFRLLFILNEFVKQPSGNFVFNVPDPLEFAPYHGNEFEWQGKTYRVMTLPYSNGEVYAWLDRNLGAEEHTEHGDLYQWGRLKDGHQNKDSNIKTEQSSTVVPGHPDFIAGFDNWLNPANNELWEGQGENVINNIAPPGWRIPTLDDFNLIRSELPSDNFGRVNASRWANGLNLTFGGTRTTEGNLLFVGDRLYYWTQTSVDSNNARYLRFALSSGVNVTVGTSFKARGASVRLMTESIGYIPERFPGLIIADTFPRVIQSTWGPVFTIETYEKPVVISGVYLDIRSEVSRGFRLQYKQGEPITEENSENDPEWIVVNERNITGNNNSKPDQFFDLTNPLVLNANTKYSFMIVGTLKSGVGEPLMASSVDNSFQLKLDLPNILKYENIGSFSLISSFGIQARFQAGRGFRGKIKYEVVEQ